MSHLETGHITLETATYTDANQPVHNMKVVPAGPTIEQIEKQANECDRRATAAAEPFATRLREEAELLREWMKLLRTGAWKA